MQVWMGLSTYTVQYIRPSHTCTPSKQGNRETTVNATKQAKETLNLGG